MQLKRICKMDMEILVKGALELQTPLHDASVSGSLSPGTGETSAAAARASPLTPKPKWAELIEAESGSSPKRPRLQSRQSSVASLSQLSQLLSDADARDADNYGVTELRDGFFDAVFLKRSAKGRHLGNESLESTLPVEFDELSPLAVGDFFPRQWREIQAVVHRVTKTRVGIQLLKSFMAIFAAYLLCLVPAVRSWLGTYHYILVCSTVFNHPARSIGSQLDGVLLTTAGTAAGFGWGVVGLLLSTSTDTARVGYGGILAMFLALFIATLAWIRAFFIRFYQAVLCAGITIIYTTVADTDSSSIKWEKLLRYLIPWLLGQALSLLVNVAIFPDTGSYRVSLSLNKALNVMSNKLKITGRRDVRQRRQLVEAVVDLSAMFRDMTLDISISRLRPADVLELRNLMQAVIRSLLAIAPATHLMHLDSDTDDTSPVPGTPVQINAETSESKDPTRQILSELEEPTREIIYSLKESLDRCNAVLMDMTKWRHKFGPPEEVSTDINSIQIRLRQALAAFDLLESDFLNSQVLLSPHLATSDAVEAFVFSRQIRESSAAVQALMSHVEKMHTLPNSSRIYQPSYPISKAVYRTNAQIRHDRGGAAAGSYQVTFNEIEQVLDKIKAKEHNPRSRHDESLKLIQSRNSNATVDTQSKNKTSARYRFWKILHRLQGFESKYAFKACMVTSLLSVPSYLDQSKDWWDKYQAWWAVVMCWVVMHPRVGGNIQDLFSRSVLAIFGAVWAGAAHAAGNGNPYVMAVFAAIYLLPMTYRFTQSTDPRSGLVGMLSFIVISLTLDDDSDTPPALLAVHRGVVFFVGTASPILVNWVLWPFVARHELRFALSSMLFYLSVVYRSVLATYVYYEAGNSPTPEDVQQSELLEGRLREGFVRIRQLLVLTRHEARLRAPFDPVAYSALTEASEQLFDHLIAVRQSALFHNAGHASDSPTADESLLSYKRDAVAAILANLYIFAGALRSHRKVPRYIPSAAAARKRLLIETEKIGERTEPADAHRKWADIYRYSYDQSLTGCVVQLEKLEQYTKLICGEQGFDDHFTSEEQEDAQQ